MICFCLLQIVAVRCSKPEIRRKRYAANIPRHNGAIAKKHSSAKKNAVILGYRVIIRNHCALRLGTFMTMLYVIAMTGKCANAKMIGGINLRFGVLRLLWNTIAAITTDDAKTSQTSTIDAYSGSLTRRVKYNPRRNDCAASQETNKERSVFIFLQTEC